MIHAYPVSSQQEFFSATASGGAQRCRARRRSSAPSRLRFGKQPDKHGMIHPLVSPVLLRQPDRVSAPRGGSASDSFPSSGLQFQLAFVFLYEGSQFIGAGQQSRTLFVIWRHRKPPEAVHAYASLAADPELHRRKATGIPKKLVLVIRRSQFFVCSVRHRAS